ncbi:uncharacterized protein EV422DRAFT_542800 [Fimicolochytrium jonesii]|uniref:uncharacterized protein n=1 Tax=Fimicolochytrium jonesii TaxID=1396493 RepID=UPI0022FF3A6C|nr:uncharacterized protein EV422DRAFT_542800 [Fimicolochytrium jonesii]KAI8817192.1 hypothetical protein EV422DRAFT_542800 [Fimicolochytrium jonesii]
MDPRYFLPPAHTREATHGGEETDRPLSLQRYDSSGGPRKLAMMEPKPNLGPTAQIPPSISLTGMYSATGFDLLGILSWVVNRPNPKIHLGPVDLSCAFLVTDPRKDQNPIVYASETFTKLTGYSNAEVLNRSCRFLQDPDGQQEKGAIRRFTDHSIVCKLKHDVDANNECQYTLINYKKGGEPFINLLTVIPVELYRPGEVSFQVGFQVDLVDQPQAILDRMRDGTYTINYQLNEQLAGSKPGAIQNSQSFQRNIAGLVSPASTTNPSDPPFLEGVEDFLDDMGDFVHILSLRGLFLYAAPRATKQLLGYSAEDVMGHNLHEFVHPSDYVAVMRELRMANPGESINILCRFRRKHSGYVYLEINGHIYEGNNSKRTKCFIMTGREKEVGSLMVDDVLLPDKENLETWVKLSRGGLVLHVCTNTIPFFGDSADSLLAKSLSENLHDSDQQMFLDALARVRSSRRIENVRCRIMLKRGVLPVVIRLYSEKCKPSTSPFTTNPATTSQTSSTVLCQIKVVEPGKTDPLDLKSIVEYKDLYSNGDLFDVMHEVRATSLQFELNQLRIQNKRLREELDMLAAPKKKHEGPQCAQCGTHISPEWRKGPDNQRNLCNACGLRYAKSVRNQIQTQTSGTPGAMPRSPGEMSSSGPLSG